MAYERTGICTRMQSPDFASNIVPDLHNISFDSAWKLYVQHRRKFGQRDEVQCVPELEELHVPLCLFNTIGVDSFMKTVFPNCKVYTSPCKIGCLGLTTVQ